MGNEIKWYKNKILGDFAEAICANHFDALGYHVEFTGIEKSAASFTKFSNLSSKKSPTAADIYKTIHKTPDILISRLYNGDLESFFIEVKYRNKVDDFKELEDELLWGYRHEIWTHNIMDECEFTKEEKGKWLKRDLEINKKLLSVVKKKYNRTKCINLPIIFYVVVKYPNNKDNHIYCNFATFPGWWNIGDKKFDKTSTYISNNTLNNYINFNEIYREEIKPALDSIFKN